MKAASLVTPFFIYLICLIGVFPSAAIAQPYVISTDGTEVTDQKTGLIWRRCSEGMLWDIATSNCIGTAITFTHEAALMRARDQANTGLAWRLPSIKELASIVDRNFRIPAIDSIAFPALAMEWFWSASPVAGELTPTRAWLVTFRSGIVMTEYRSVNYYVRLVRAG